MVAVWMSPTVERLQAPPWVRPHAAVRQSRCSRLLLQTQAALHELPQSIYSGSYGADLALSTLNFRTVTASAGLYALPPGVA